MLDRRVRCLRVPMVVWRDHDPPPPRREGALHARLAAVVEQHFGYEHYVDDNLRSIPTHYHAHARPSGGLRRRPAPPFPAVRPCEAAARVGTASSPATTSCRDGTSRAVPARAVAAARIRPGLRKATTSCSCSTARRGAAVTTILRRSTFRNVRAASHRSTTSTRRTRSSPPARAAAPAGSGGGHRAVDLVAAAAATPSASRPRRPGGRAAVGTSRSATSSCRSSSSGGWHPPAPADLDSQQVANPGDHRLPRQPSVQQARGHGGRRRRWTTSRPRS